MKIICELDLHTDKTWKKLQTFKNETKYIDVDSIGSEFNDGRGLNGVMIDSQVCFLYMYRSEPSMIQPKVSHCASVH